MNGKNSISRTGEGRSLNKELICSVLNYWNSYDFLNQSSLKTELSRQEKEALEYALTHEGRSQKPSLICKDILEEGEELSHKLRELLAERHMKCTGNITIYIGSVSRNYCIKRIISEVGEGEQREASLSELAAASIQVTPELEYVPGTFSLSPVIWSMHRISRTHGAIDACRISKEFYDVENRNLETELCPAGVRLTRERSAERAYHEAQDKLYTLQLALDAANNSGTMEIDIELQD